MRISASKDYPGYDDHAPSCTVLFNGAEVRYVVYADEYLGRIVQYVVDAAGKFVVEGDRIKTVERFGCVAISFPPHLREHEERLREAQNRQRKRARYVD